MAHLHFPGFHPSYSVGSHPFVALGAGTALRSALSSQAGGADAYRYLALTDGADRFKTSLRNSLGFHAALFLLVNGAMERLVVPYLYGTEGSGGLDGLSLGSSGGSVGAHHMLEGQGAPACLADPSVRAELGTESRMAPYEFWKAASDVCHGAHGATKVVVHPDNPGSQNPADVEVYPPVVHPSLLDSAVFRSHEAPEGDVDSFDDWVSEGPDAAYHVGLRTLSARCVCEMVFDGGPGAPGYCSTVSPPVLGMFAELVAEALGSSSGQVTGDLGCLVDFRLYAGYWWGDMAGRSSGWLSDRDRTSGEWWGGAQQRFLTYRANLDVMRLYQLYLGLMWANWARVRMPGSDWGGHGPQLKFRHIRKTRTVTYHVDRDDGSVSAVGDPSVEETVEYLPYLKWARAAPGVDAGGTPVFSDGTGVRQFSLDALFGAIDFDSFFAMQIGRKPSAFASLDPDGDGSYSAGDVEVECGDIFLEDVLLASLAHPETGPYDPDWPTSFSISSYVLFPEAASSSSSTLDGSSVGTLPSWPADAAVPFLASLKVGVATGLEDDYHAYVPKASPGRDSPPYDSGRSSDWVPGAKWATMSFADAGLSSGTASGILNAVLGMFTGGALDDLVGRLFAGGGGPPRFDNRNPLEIVGVFGEPYDCSGQVNISSAPSFKVTFRVPAGADSGTVVHPVKIDLGNDNVAHLGSGGTWVRDYTAGDSVAIEYSWSLTAYGPGIFFGGTPEEESVVVRPAMHLAVRAAWDWKNLPATVS